MVRCLAHVKRKRYVNAFAMEQGKKQPGPKIPIPGAPEWPLQGVLAIHGRAAPMRGDRFLAAIVKPLPVSVNSTPSIRPIPRRIEIKLTAR
jgi:hypothetical protein